MRLLATLCPVGDLSARNCERDGYIHPAFPQGPPPTVQPSGKPVNPYVLATPATTNVCARTTGT